VITPSGSDGSQEGQAMEAFPGDYRDAGEGMILPCLLEGKMELVKNVSGSLP
jgi:hypothetical protein